MSVLYPWTPTCVAVRHYLEGHPDPKIRRKAHHFRNWLAWNRLLGKREWHYD
jgi:hypothetical protein